MELLRLGGSEVVDRADHLVIRTPDNPGFWWGNFLLLAEVPDADESLGWLDRFHAEFPDAEHVAMGFDTTDSKVRGAGWFADHGFSVEAATVMTAHDLSAPRSAVDADCRRLVSEDDWQQSLRLNLGDADDASAQLAFLEARMRTKRKLADAGHGAWFGAFHDGRLVAELGLMRIGGGLARYQSVLTDPAFRRRGYATALLAFAGRYGFAELGANTLVIVVDPANPAVHLYRSIGFFPVETQLQVERPPA